MGQIDQYGKRSEELSGELKIALPETLLIYRMPPILKAFRAQATGVHVVMQTTNCYTIANHSSNGVVDFGLYYDVDDDPPSAV